MPKVRLARAARADLAAIDRYTRDTHGTAAADRYTRGFLAAFALLDQHPEAGPMQPMILPDVRCLVHRRHRIFYRVQGNEVLIIRVLHHARDTRVLLS